MTLPNERTASILRARELLIGLSSPYGANGIKGIRGEVRRQARDILRHFPFWFDLGRADCFDQQEAMKWANQNEEPER